jgi:hypothetical protein
MCRSSGREGLLEVYKGHLPPVLLEFFSYAELIATPAISLNRYTLPSNISHQLRSITPHIPHLKTISTKFDILHHV